MKAAVLAKGYDKSLSAYRADPERAPGTPARGVDRLPT
jgi:hypothetical protein